MKVVGMMGRVGHKFMDIASIKNSLFEEKHPSKDRSKIIRNGAVGLALLVGVVAVVSPLVKSQLLINGEVEKIELVSIQEETANFLTLNTLAVNYANASLTDIYNYVASGFTEEQVDIITAQKYSLMEYKNQLSPSNSMFLDLSLNTTQKLNILISAIDDILDPSTSQEQDMINFNRYTQEYKELSENEQQLLISLLDYSGMNYEILPNGQIHYSYLKMDEQ